MGLVVGPDRVGRGGRIAGADSGLKSPHRQRFPATNSNLFTGSAPERNDVGPGLLAKTVPVRDPWRSNTACE